MRKAPVIGAGLGGLALAIRLQSAGISTTLIEARDVPGGCAGCWQRDGFTFDAGPGAITDPNGLSALWALSGRDMAADVALKPITPFYRMSWPDGTSLDWSNDGPGPIAEVVRLSPADVDGFERFSAYATKARREAWQRLGDESFLDLKTMAMAVPGLLRHQAWRSLHGVIGGHVKDERLRQALGVPCLAVGANPMAASALHALVHDLMQDTGLWYVAGGIGRLAAALATQFERLGGVLRLGDPVVRIETLGDRVTGLQTRSGWRDDFEAVASNADILHSYRDLLSTSARGRRAASEVAKMRVSPSGFMVHFGIRGSWPGIPHHMILFGSRYKTMLDDIHVHGVLPRDVAIHLQHPSVTDPSLAPEGYSSFSAFAAVPHLGKLPVDWSVVGPILEQRILDEIERRLIPELRQRIVTCFTYGPDDFRRDLGVHHGSPFGLASTRSQSGWFRPHHRDDAIANLYFVGANTHPGPGIPAVLAGAKATATLMLDDLRL